MCLLLGGFLLIAQVIETPLHDGPEADQDTAYRLAPGSGIVIPDTGVHSGNEFQEQVHEFTRVAGQVIHLARPHVLDQKIEHDAVVVVLPIDHLFDVRYQLGIPQVVQGNAPRKPARELKGRSGIHIAVLQDILQSGHSLQDHRPWDRIALILHCGQDLRGIELLSPIQARRQ